MNSFARDATHMLIKRVIHPAIIPKDGTAGRQDTIDFAADIDRHSVVQNRGEHRKHRHQIEGTICKWQRLRIGQLKCDPRKVLLSSADAIGNQINAKQVFWISSQIRKRSQMFSRATAHIEDTPPAQREKTSLPEHLAD